MRDHSFGLSCGSKRNTYKVRTGFAVFQTVCHDSKGESLNLCLGLFRSAAIGESPRQINDFCDPTTVFFLLDFHPKVHKRDLTTFGSA